MRATSLRSIATLATALLVGCGQSDSVTAPPVAARAQRTILPNPATVHVITRNTPLSQPVSTSAYIGAFGGVLSIPSAGLTVVVPPFALTSPTRITVTALAGNQLAYEFAPHGTRFLVPLVATQSLVGTSGQGTLLPPLAGYFASVSDLNPLAGTALVSELLNTSLGVGGLSATFPIFHFSGYLLASGAGASEDDSSR
jgi:hypothetical protein